MFQRTRILDSAIALLVAAALVLPGDRASAQSVDFEGYPVGTLGSALNIPGVSFAGSPDNQWLIYPGSPDVNGVFSTVSGHILIDPVADGSSSALDITFDSPRASVSFIVVAGHKDGPAPSIFAQADNNGVAGYSGLLALSVPPGGNYYEGEVTIPGPLTHLRLATRQQGFGIDNLTSVGMPVIRVPDVILNPNLLIPLPTPELRIPVVVPSLPLPRAGN